MGKDRSLNWQEMSRSVGPCIRPGGTFLTGRALGVCKLPTDARIIDIGCGAGGTLEFLQGFGNYDLVGIDPSEQLLQEAAARVDSARLVLGEAEALPFEDGSFDVVLCECVLSILDDPAAALTEFQRVLKEGGFLVVSDLFTPPSPASGDAPANRQGQQKHLFLGDPGTLERNGFTMVLWEDHKKLLKEFVVQMIFADQPLPDAWCCSQGAVAKKHGPGTSYYLMVARKSGGALHGDGAIDAPPKGAFNAPLPLGIED